MTKEKDISKMKTTSFDEAYLKQVLFGSPIYVNSEEVAELVQKHLDGLAEDIKVVKKENAELLEKIEKLEKQLNIAVNTLEVIERMSDKFDNSLGFIEQLDCIKADCQETLYYLKEIDEV